MTTKAEQVLTDAYHNFIKRIPNENTRQCYVYRLQTFFKYCQVDNYDQLLYDGNIKLIQTRIEDYIIHIQVRGLSSGSVTGHINAIKYFYTMNDITTLNWYKINRVKKPYRKAANDRPYTTSEIAKLLESSDLRGRCCILLMCSSGMRRGGIPPLKLAHLQKMGDGGIYKIIVYHNDPEEYFTFCSPECARTLDQYFDYRKRCGEILKPSSPVIRKQFNKDNPEAAANPMPIGVKLIDDLVYRAVNDSGLREKKNVIKGEKKVLHDVMESHGLRKFFQSQVVIAGMPVLYSEILMGHKSGGLAIASYVKPTTQQLYSEYMAVVDSVTISEELRTKQENTQLKKRVTEMDELRQEITKVKERLNL